MNHCEFIVMERQCLLAIRLMSRLILMSGYFKVIIFIRSWGEKKKGKKNRKRKKKRAISMHN